MNMNTQKNQQTGIMNTVAMAGKFSGNERTLFFLNWLALISQLRVCIELMAKNAFLIKISLTEFPIKALQVWKVCETCRNHDFYVHKRYCCAPQASTLFKIKRRVHATNLLFTMGTNVHVTLRQSICF